MTYNKKIQTVEYFVLAIWAGYLETSLFALIFQLDINRTSSEVKFWALNLFIAIVLSFPYIVIHEIIKNYSAYQILENIKWHNLRKVKLFKIMITIGLGLLLIPTTYFMFSLFLIPTMNTYLIGLVIILAITGLVLLIIGMCLIPKNKEMNNKQLSSVASSPNAPESKIGDSRIKYAYLGFFVVNWMVLMPILVLIFRFLLSMSLLLIAIITVIWSLVSIFFLIYIERKK